MNLEKAKRIVIKIGSALVVNQETGRLHATWLKTLVEDVVALRRLGKQVVLVSSGAVALGRRYLDLTSSPHKLKLEQKQAAAACGQIELCKHYQQLFGSYDIAAGQILLTLTDTENRRRYLNARNTLDTMLDNGIIPIINENDTIATNEIRFGDNDRLAARVAQMAEAEVLVLLSDIDGLYTKDPRHYPDAQHIATVTSITKKIEAMGGGSSSDTGSGGMITKIAAAKIASGAGCHTVITKGFTKNPLKALQDGGVCTWFISEDNPARARKHWIASSLHVKGEIVVDKGALTALKKGKSLLPAGVIAINGHFERGDAVLIRDWNNKEVGKGLTAYSSEDATVIKGQQSSAIEHLLGFAGREELIHADNLALNEEE